MNPTTLLLLFLLLAAADAEEPARLDLPAPFGHSMVLRSRVYPDEPVVPWVRFSAWNVVTSRFTKVNATLGGVPLSTAPELRQPVDGWWRFTAQPGKTPPLSSGDLEIQVATRPGTPVAARWTNVVQGQVWLFGDRPGWGLASEVALGPCRNRSLRLLVSSVEAPSSDWIDAQPAWVQPSLNPLPLSPHAKTLIAVLLTNVASTPIGLVVTPAASLRASQENRVALGSPDSAWLKNHQFYSAALTATSIGETALSTLEQRRFAAVVQAQRHGRVLPTPVFTVPQAPLVFIQGNLRSWPAPLDAALW